MRRFVPFSLDVKWTRGSKLKGDDETKVVPSDFPERLRPYPHDRAPNRKTLSALISGKPIQLNSFLLSFFSPFSNREIGSEGRFAGTFQLTSAQ